MEDFNNYIPIQRYHQFFAKLGLGETITENYGTEGPGTTRSNKRNKTIDGI